MIQDTNVLFQLIRSGMLKPLLMDKVKKRKLNNVMFHNSVPNREVFKYTIASDLGTSVTKRTDTFKTIYSNKTFDYMACKKPILLVIDGVSRDFVEKAECGTFAEPENPANFATKI